MVASLLKGLGFDWSCESLKVKALLQKLKPFLRNTAGGMVKELRAVLGVQCL